MSKEQERYEQLLSALMPILRELEALIAETKKASKEDAKTEIDLEVFFAGVRKSLFAGKLTTKQVSGMEAKIRAFRKAGFSLSWAAYAMATSYHETASRMQPVREGLSLSDAWRKKNLRYYPWYGRGDVQLTWEANYKKADKELGLGGALVANLDLALDPDISAEIMVKGMEQGWFSGSKTQRYSLPLFLPMEEATLANFTGARKIINLMDKAALIAGYAVKFQAALKAAGYGKVN